MIKCLTWTVYIDDLPPDDSMHDQQLQLIEEDTDSDEDDNRGRANFYSVENNHFVSPSGIIYRYTENHSEALFALSKVLPMA